MTLKNKIRTVAAIVVIGVMAWVFWRAQDKGAVTILFEGVSATNTDYVLFTFTNSFKTAVEYSVVPVVQRDGRWKIQHVSLPDGMGKIMGRSSKTFTMRVYNTYQWKLAVTHADSLVGSFASKVRKKLAKYASDRRWPRLSQWLLPPDRSVTAYSVELFGNKPMPAEQK